MVDLEQILRVALNNENVKTLEENSVFREYEPFWKPYWILSELESFITGRKSVDSFFDTLQHGTEVMVSLDDPWSFLALHYLHLPTWILRKALNFNFEWSYDEFVACQF